LFSVSSGFKLLAYGAIVVIGKLELTALFVEHFYSYCMEINKIIP